MKRTHLFLFALVLGLLAPSADAFSKKKGIITSSGASTTNASTASPFVITDVDTTSTNLRLAIVCDQAVWMKIGTGATTATSTDGEPVKAWEFVPFERLSADTVAILPQAGNATTCLVYVTTEHVVHSGAPPTAGSGSVTVSNSSMTSCVETEVLCGTSSTAAPASPMSGRRSIEFQNLGPNQIWIHPTTAVAGTTRRILPGDSWSTDSTDAVTWKCLSSTAAQVTTAATIVTECK